MTTNHQQPSCLFDHSLDQGFTVVTEMTREGRGLWEKCNHCGLVINRSAVDPKQTSEYYNKDYAERYRVEERVALARQYFDSRLPSIQRVVEKIRPHLNKKISVLEIGAATGELLWSIRNEVAFCFANEINQDYVAFIQKELGIEASSQEYLESVFPEKFDFVITINTLDHLPDPLKVLRKVYDDLRPGGMVYLEVPNDDQALKTLLPEPHRTAFANFMYQKAHYYSFTFSTIRKLIHAAGFSVVDEFSRHEYTVNNFLHWYFTGQPQKKFFEATVKTDLFAGDSPFEKEMNLLFQQIDEKFRVSIERNRGGESLCVLARKE